MDDNKGRADGLQNTGGASGGTKEPESGGTQNTGTPPIDPQQMFNLGFARAREKAEKEMKEILAEKERLEQELKKVSEEHQRIVGRLQEFGLSPDKLEMLKELEQKKETEKERLEKALKEQAQKYEEMIKKTKEEAEFLRRTLFRQTVEKELALAAQKYNAWDAKQVVKLLRDNVKMEKDEKTGEFRLVVYDDDGTERYTQKGEPMTVEELVKEFLEKNPNLVKAQSQAGAGTQKPGGTPGLGQETPRTAGEAIALGLKRLKAGT